MDRINKLKLELENKNKAIAKKEAELQKLLEEQTYKCVRTKYSRIYYKDDIRHGLCEYYDKNGKLEVIKYYNKGIKHGMRKYYEDGILDTLECYLDDKNYGFYIRYRNGIGHIVMCSHETKDDKYHIQYYEDKTIKSIETITDGIIDGLCEYFYPNGNIKQIYYKKQETSKKGLPIFDVDGTPEYEHEFFDVEFYKNGSIKKIDDYTNLDYYRDEAYNYTTSRYYAQNGKEIDVDEIINDDLDYYLETNKPEYDYSNFVNDNEYGFNSESWNDYMDEKEKNKDEETSRKLYF